MSRRVVLAYSGGLDTSVAIRWMIEQWSVEVVALAVDVGQAEDWDQLRRRALAAGAKEVEVVDAKEVFANQFCARALLANALYEGRYPLVSALSRPVIVEALVAAARRHGADAVAHGCTGKGNDQVRFEVSARALAPDLEVLAPSRVWKMSRADAITYAAKWNIPVTALPDKPYSIDENLWGRAIEAGILEDPWVAPPEEVFTLTQRRDLPAAELVVGFEAGLPVSIDARSVSLAEAVAEMNAFAGRFGWGRIDMVENRRVGIKSREVYEAPGALALIAAHQDLEGLCLEREQAHYKRLLEARWAEAVYDGMWHSPLREALDAFMIEANRNVTGEVRLRVEPGAGCFVVGRRSPKGLYDPGLATYGPSGDTFDQSLAEGFVRIFGQQIASWAARQGGPKLGSELSLRS